MSKQHALKVIYDYEPRLTIGEEIIEYGKNYKLTLDDGHVLIGKFIVKNQCEGYDIDFISDFYVIHLPSNYCEKDLDDHIVAIERID